MLGRTLFDDLKEVNTDLTPLIDVVFILLVFFILSSTFIKPSVPLDLPSSPLAGTDAELTDPLEISIDVTGQIFIQGEPTAGESVRGILAQKVEMPLCMHIDKAAPFDAFLCVMDAAKSLNITKITLVTEPGCHE